eukprot:tig00000912_g5430.t1
MELDGDIEIVIDVSDDVEIEDAVDGSSASAPPVAASDPTPHPAAYAAGLETEGGPEGGDGMELEEGDGGGGSTVAPDDAELDGLLAYAQHKLENEYSDKLESKYSDKSTSDEDAGARLDDALDEEWVPGQRRRRPAGTATGGRGVRSSRPAPPPTGQLQPLLPRRIRGASSSPVAHLLGRLRWGPDETLEYDPSAPVKDLTVNISCAHSGSALPDPGPAPLAYGSTAGVIMSGEAEEAVRLLLDASSAKPPREECGACRRAFAPAGFVNAAAADGRRGFAFSAVFSEVIAARCAGCARPYHPGCRGEGGALPPPAAAAPFSSSSSSSPSSLLSSSGLRMLSELRGASPNFAGLVPRSLWYCPRCRLGEGLEGVVDAIVKLFATVSKRDVKPVVVEGLLQRQPMRGQLERTGALWDLFKAANRELVAFWQHGGARAASEILWKPLEGATRAISKEEWSPSEQRLLSDIPCGAKVHVARDGAVPAGYSRAAAAELLRRGEPGGSFGDLPARDTKKKREAEATKVYHLTFDVEGEEYRRCKAGVRECVFAYNAGLDGLRLILEEIAVMGTGFWRSVEGQLYSALCSKQPGKGGKGGRKRLVDASQDLISEGTFERLLVLRSTHRAEAEAAAAAEKGQSGREQLQGCFSTVWTGALQDAIQAVREQLERGRDPESIRHRTHAVKGERLDWYSIAVPPDRYNTESGYWSFLRRVRAHDTLPDELHHIARLNDKNCHPGPALSSPLVAERIFFCRLCIACPLEDARAARTVERLGAAGIERVPEKWPRRDYWGGWSEGLRTRFKSTVDDKGIFKVTARAVLDDLKESFKLDLEKLKELGYEGLRAVKQGRSVIGVVPDDSRRLKLRRKDGGVTQWGARVHRDALDGVRRRLLGYREEAWRSECFRSLSERFVSVVDEIASSSGGRPTAELVHTRLAHGSPLGVTPLTLTVDSVRSHLQRYQYLASVASKQRRPLMASSSSSQQQQQQQQQQPPPPPASRKAIARRNVPIPFAQGVAQGHSRPAEAPAAASSSAAPRSSGSGGGRLRGATPEETARRREFGGAISIDPGVVTSLTGYDGAGRVVEIGPGAYLKREARLRDAERAMDMSKKPVLRKAEAEAAREKEKKVEEKTAEKKKRREDREKARMAREEEQEQVPPEEAETARRTPREEATRVARAARVARRRAKDPRRLNALAAADDNAMDWGRDEEAGLWGGESGGEGAGPVAAQGAGGGGAPAGAPPLRAATTGGSPAAAVVAAPAAGPSGMQTNQQQPAAKLPAQQMEPQQRLQLRKQGRLLHRALRIYARVRNRCTEDRRCAIRYFVENYDDIYTPAPPVSAMVRRGRRVLRGWVARQMLFFGHYKFREDLYLASRLRPGCRVHIVREDYTSKTCGCCGHIHSKLRGNKVFRCPACRAIMDRDFNGARNIMLRVASGVDDADGRPPPLEVVGAAGFNYT